nr:retrotransposon protein, putative, Ty1-copia subclass [Triticum aestivum]
MANAHVNMNFNAFLEKTKLKDDGSNYSDWVRNLRIILIAAKKDYVLDAPLGEAPIPENQDVMNTWQSRADDYSLVQCDMLHSLEPGLQKRFERHGAYEMFEELKMIFQAHARVERYEVSDKFYSCKMEENSSVSEHILKMSGLHNRLSQLEINLPDKAVIDRILQSLPPSYKSFVLNYNMQGMVKTIPEVFSMLKLAEVEIKKEHQVLMVNKTTKFKKGKGKKNFKKDGKDVAAPGKPVTGKKSKNGPKPETECFYCKGKGHWKRNCPKYLADKKAGNTKVWGCDAYVKKLQPEKLEPKSEKCIFIGYPKKTIGYTFYLRSKGKIFVVKNESFLEKEFLSKGVSGRKVELDEVLPLEPESSAVQENVPVVPTPTGEEINDDDQGTSDQVATELHRSTRTHPTPEWYGNPVLEIMLLDNDEPSNYEEAMAGPDSNKLLEAMQSEIESMYENKVWTLTDLPDERRAIENKWIFKKKTDADGNVTIYKARLVAKGYRQVQGIDYDEIFSPVTKLKSVRIMLAIAAYYDYEIWQMDVKTAFLNGYLKEELYMMQPKGFVDPKNANKVCKLQRSIYGLVQASRSWNIRFDEMIKAFGFMQTYGEACVYKKVSGSSVAFLILYVDDILLMGNDIEFLDSIKAYLNKCFSMKDLGEAAYILGIKIYRDRSRRLIGLSQSTYLDKILKKFKMDQSKKGFLPVLQGVRLSTAQCPTTAKDKQEMSVIPYASAIGSITYAMLCTKPDVNLAISLIGRYQSNPGKEHWTAVKNILKYLKRIKDMFLVYGGDEELVVKGYVDASFDTDLDDSKSQTGYVYMLNGGAVSWCSCKQSVVAGSTCEAEYMAASEAAHEAIWVKEFITDLGVIPNASGPMKLFCDNTGAIALAKEPRFHKKTRHIKRHFNSIRENVQDGDIDICKVHMDLNVVDPLTKPLPRAKHDQHQNFLDVRFITM